MRDGIAQLDSIYGCISGFSIVAKTLYDRFGLSGDIKAQVQIQMQTPAEGGVCICIC